jgi:hypothetical protein
MRGKMMGFAALYPSYARIKKPDAAIASGFPISLCACAYFRLSIAM